MVYPDIAATWRNVDRPPDAVACARVQAIFAALDKLDNENYIGAQLFKSENGVEYGYLRFDDEAQDFFNSWREDLETSLRGGSFEHPALEDHLSKYRKLMPALALIFHLLDRLSGEIQATAVSKDAAQRAAAWCTFLETHARRVYGLAINADVTRAKTLLQHLQQGDLPDEFSARDVYMKHWAGLATSREVAEPLTILEDHGWLRSFAITGEETGGRPTARHLVHPSLRREQTRREAA
jgi:putative DNA primase/helicase